MSRMLAIGAVAAAVVAVNAAPAVAQTPVSLSFNNVVLDTPATPNLAVVTPQGTPLTVIADVDPTTGDFTIAPSDFHFSTYTLTSPLPGTVSLALNSAATGTVDFSTGQVSLTADLEADISLTGFGACDIDTGSLTLTTQTMKPLPGKAFPAGATGIATGPGAFGAGWSTLPAGTGSGCATIDAAVDGPGGIWISNGISPSNAGTTGAAKLAVTASSKGAKAGKKATLSVTVKNSGAASASDVKVCATASKPLKPTKRTCRTIGTLKSSANKTVAFKLATKAGKTGRFAVKVAVTATGLKSTRTTAKIKVTK